MGSQFKLWMKKSPLFIAGMAVTASLFFVGCQKERQRSDQNVRTQEQERSARYPDTRVSQQQQRAQAEFNQQMDAPQGQSSEGYDQPVETGPQLHPALPSVEGLVTYSLGDLRYWLIEEGAGPEPSHGNRVKVHYTGWLANGKKFDSSFDRNQPFQFTLGGRVIKGWNMMAAKMKRGDLVLVEIPSHLGYGNKSVGGGLIPANSTLYFKIQMLDFQ